MNKKLQVFVSSTYTDLIEERQAAVQAILDAGHIPAGMELFKAGNESQLKTIYKWIDESDVYMLILGGRYGSVEEKSGKSYTQLEYEYALSKDIPVFAVVLSDLFLTRKITSLGLKNVIEQDHPEIYKFFKTFVMSKIIREVDDCKDIKIQVHVTLNKFIHEYDLIGWTRQRKDENINFTNIIKENNLLKKQLQELQDEYNCIKFVTQNKTSKTNEDLAKDSKEVLFSSLEKKLSVKRLIYKGYTRTALAIFKIKYMDHTDHDSIKFVQEEYLDNASFYLEKCGLVTLEMHANMNLYRFSISSLGIEFCNYLECNRK